MNIPIGKIIIGLFIIGVTVLFIGLYQAGQELPILPIGIVLFVVGSIAFLTSEIILLAAAFSQDLTTGLLFAFVPLYPLVFAFTQYDGEKKGLIITAWFGGSLLMLIGVLLYLFYGDGFWGIF